ncbi:MAG: ATP-binding protein [Candidatus Hydrothermarchaeales archaeon]
MDVELLSKQNSWWKNREEIKKDEKVLQALSRKHKLIQRFEKGNFLIIGPRQVGKTTFLKLMILDLLKNTASSNILYFSCEPLSKKEDIFELVGLFDRLGRGEKFLFLDEITFVRDWEAAVKFLLDSGMKNLYITGSTSATLKKERFPGREINFREFLPLNFREFCLLFGSGELKNTLKDAKARIEEVFDKSFKLLPFIDELQELFERYIVCGGFPLSAFQLMENGGIKEETYETYVNWILGDISKLDRSERIFKSVVQGVIKNYGSRFSLNSVAKEMEIGSHVTVREYLEFLEKCFLLRNYFKFDLSRNLPVYRAERKVYFIDPFLFRVFSRYAFGASDVSAEKKPSLVEGIVGEYLKRNRETFFFHGRKEVDFIVNNTGIEVKYGKVDKKDFPKIDLKNKILLSKNQWKDFDDVKAIPIPVFISCSIVF